MRHRIARLLVTVTALTLSASVYAQQPQPQPATPAQAPPPAAENKPRSPWLLVPMFSSSPKLGTAIGGMGAYMHVFDEKSRVSLFGVSYQYTTTHSQIFSTFARTSSGADHHRIVVLSVFGHIENDYDDYLGTGESLRTEDDLKAFVGRYQYRVKGNWFIGGQGSAANYQVMGATAEDDLALETLGVKGFVSAGLGATVMHDSRDNQDMPTTGWFVNVNNIAYRESLGGSATFDAYRVDFKTFWKHGAGHVLAVRQYNWLTSDAPSAAQATVNLRGYKQGQYLSPYLSTLEIEERWAFNPSWGATFFTGVGGLYGDAPIALDRSVYPIIGAGLQYVLKPVQRMNINLEYAQGVDDNRGVYLKLGYAW